MTNFQTNQAGQWTSGCLPVGEYIISVAPSAKGLAAARKTVRLAAGASVVRAQISLPLKGVENSIDVDGNDPLGGGAENGAGEKSLDAADLQQLADDPDDLTRELQAMALGAGGAPGRAIITVDGFQNASRLPPKSAIREVIVNPDLFSAEYQDPPFQGGRIEVYTKPGQDKWHGALFAGDAPSWFNARDPLELSRQPASRQRYGIELSGPIIARRADFSVDLERRSINEFATIDAEILDASGNPVESRSYVAAPQKLWVGSARTDWQWNAANTFSLSFGANANAEHNQGVGGQALLDAGYNANVTQYDLRLSETDFVSANLLQEFRLGWTWKDTRQDPFSSVPSVNVAGAFVSGGSSAQATNDRERDLEVDDTVSWSHQAHSFKFGLQSITAFVHNVSPETFNGTYTFSGGIVPVLDAAGQPVADQTQYVAAIEVYRRTLLGLAGGTPALYTITQGNPLISLSQLRLSLFAQDQWKVAHRFSLALGMRYSAQNSPASLGTWAPRIGLAWSPDKRQRTVVHARVGLFDYPVDINAAQEVMRLNGVRQVQRTVYSPSFSDPLSDSAARQVDNLRSWNADVRPARAVQAHLGVEHTFPHQWHSQANWYWARGWGIMHSENVNAPLVSADGVVDPITSTRPLGQGFNQFQFKSDASLGGSVLFLGLNQTSYKLFRVFAGYVFSDLHSSADSVTEFPETASFAAREWSRPSYQTSHQGILVTSFKLPLQISLGPDLNLSSGAPYNVTTGADNNADGVFNDRPSVVEQGGTGIFTSPLGPLSVNATNGTLGRNAGTLPFTVSMDSTLSRSFAIAKRNPDRGGTLVLSLRAANLINHTNVTAVDNVAGSSLFTQPIAALTARRMELNARYSF